jgi:muramoyltetrapeptide carboxypeptidase
LKFSIWSGSHILKKADLVQGLKNLQKLGFQYEISKDVEAYSVRNREPLLPFLAGNDQLKIEELLKIIRNPNSQWILATRGGYGCLRLLKELDAVSIDRKEPLHIWGYSDLTVLQLYFWQRKGWSYVQGPLLGSETFINPSSKEEKTLKNISRFGTFPSSFSVKSFDRKVALSKDKHLLLGGNLASIVSMLGTPWEPKPSHDFLLFLEDIDEAGYKCDRLMTQLSSSRFFDSCKGIILGHFTNSKGFQNVFKSLSKNKKIPVLWGIPMGHQKPRIPLLMGSKVYIEKNRLFFDTQDL